MSNIEIIFHIFAWIVGSAVGCLLMSIAAFTAPVSSRWILVQNIIIFIIVGVCVIVTASNTIDRRIQEEKELISWQENSCPVYKSECGGKQKYACERRAVVVGRNQVGEIFVEAYPTCK